MFWSTPKTPELLTPKPSRKFQAVWTALGKFKTKLHTHAHLTEARPAGEPLPNLLVVIKRKRPSKKKWTNLKFLRTGACNGTNCTMIPNVRISSHVDHWRWRLSAHYLWASMNELRLWPKLSFKMTLGNSIISNRPVSPEYLWAAWFFFCSQSCLSDTVRAYCSFVNLRWTTISATLSSMDFDQPIYFKNFSCSNMLGRCVVNIFFRDNLSAGSPSSRFARRCRFLFLNKNAAW